jgi:hypothetical protein
MNEFNYVELGYDETLDEDEDIAIMVMTPVEYLYNIFIHKDINLLDYITITNTFTNDELCFLLDIDDPRDINQFFYQSAYPSCREDLIKGMDQKGLTREGGRIYTFRFYYSLIKGSEGYESLFQEFTATNYWDALNLFHKYLMNDEKGGYLPLHCRSTVKFSYTDYESNPYNYGIPYSYILNNVDPSEFEKNNFIDSLKEYDEEIYPESDVVFVYPFQVHFFNEESIIELVSSTLEGLKSSIARYMITKFGEEVEYSVHLLSWGETRLEFKYDQELHKKVHIRGTKNSFLQRTFFSYEDNMNDFAKSIIINSFDFNTLKDFVNKSFENPRVFHNAGDDYEDRRLKIIDFLNSMRKRYEIPTYNDNEESKSSTVYPLYLFIYKANIYEKVKPYDLIEQIDIVIKAKSESEADETFLNRMRLEIADKENQQYYNVSLKYVTEIPEDQLSANEKSLTINDYLQSFGKDRVHVCDNNNNRVYLMESMCCDLKYYFKVILSGLTTHSYTNYTIAPNAREAVKSVLRDAAEDPNFSKYKYTDATVFVIDRCDCDDVEIFDIEDFVYAPAFMFLQNFILEMNTRTNIYDFMCIINSFPGSLLEDYCSSFLSEKKMTYNGIISEKYDNIIKLKCQNIINNARNSMYDSYEKVNIPVLVVDREIKNENEVPSYAKFIYAFHYTVEVFKKKEKSYEPLYSKDINIYAPNEHEADKAFVREISKVDTENTVVSLLFKRMTHFDRTTEQLETYDSNDYIYAFKDNEEGLADNLCTVREYGYYKGSPALYKRLNDVRHFISMTENEIKFDNRVTCNLIYNFEIEFNFDNSITNKSSLTVFAPTVKDAISQYYEYINKLYPTYLSLIKFTGIKVRSKKALNEKIFNKGLPAFKSLFLINLFNNWQNLTNDEIRCIYDSYSAEEFNTILDPDRMIKFYKHLPEGLKTILMLNISKCKTVFDHTDIDTGIHSNNNDETEFDDLDSIEKSIDEGLSSAADEREIFAMQANITAPVKIRYLGDSSNNQSGVKDNSPLDKNVKPEDFVDAINAISNKLVDQLTAMGNKLETTVTKFCDTVERMMEEE